MGKTLIAREIQCKTALNKTGIPGYQYCMNPYVGCTHACIYCYASFMCRFTGHSEPWGEFLDVKVNFPSVLGKQLSRRTRPHGKVLIGTVTDAYQPAEARYGLTRTSLEILADYKQLEVHILTKSALVQRDTEILKQIPAAQVGFTITTMDSRVARVLDPGASAPSLRLGAARRLRDAGLPVWVFIAPLLPGLTDTEPSLYHLWNSLREAGIEEIMVDYLNPYPAVVHRLRAAYRDYFPEALPFLEEYLRHPAAYQEQTDQRIAIISDGCQGGRSY